jgi:hypothetical protein
MRVYYGWIVLGVAAAAMVGTLPGRTQGLGLITEPLLTDLGIDRLAYAELNFWATILGSRAGSVRARSRSSALRWSANGSCGGSMRRWRSTAS